VLFNSLIEFVTSGLLQSPESIDIEALDGFLRLSCANASGTLEYSVDENQWRLRNANGAFAPIMSGINGVPGPDLTLEGGANVTLTPDYGAGKITISASVPSGTTINGQPGPFTLVGASGIEVVTVGNTITFTHAPGAWVIGASGLMEPSARNIIINHGLGTRAVNMTFAFEGGSRDGRIFFPGRLTVVDEDSISMRLDLVRDFTYTIIGLKG